jgi:hypothetical protein
MDVSAPSPMAVEAEVARRKGKKIPLNIDGATAVIYANLDSRRR